MIIGLHHVALGVDDLDKAIAFYTEAFGFEVVQRGDFDKVEQVDKAIGLTDAKAKMAMLQISNAFVEVWEYSNPVPRDKRSLPSDYGYPHIAFQVEDIEAEYVRLQGFGMSFVGEVVRFGEATAAIYGRDPFGNVIELYQINLSEIPQLRREG